MRVQAPVTCSKQLVKSANASSTEANQRITVLYQMRPVVVVRCRVGLNSPRRYCDQRPRRRWHGRKLGTFSFITPSLSSRAISSRPNMGIAGQISTAQDLQMRSDTNHNAPKTRLTWTSASGSLLAACEEPRYFEKLPAAKSRAIGLKLTMAVMSDEPGTCKQCPGLLYSHCVLTRAPRRCVLALVMAMISIQLEV